CEATLAVPSAVVGFVRTEMYGSRSSPCCAGAALVFAICVKLRIPSYMRAPPEAATMTTAQRWAVPYSIVRVIFSPTTDPMVAAGTDTLILRQFDFRHDFRTAGTLLKKAAGNFSLLAGFRLDCWLLKDCHETYARAAVAA